MYKFIVSFALFLPSVLFGQVMVDSVTFEKLNPALHIDTSSSNIWQIGNPQKNFFNSAYSPTKAIVTDTIKSYPANNTSSFTYTFYKKNTPCFNSLTFGHKYDTDTLTDVGLLEASYDGGKTWYLIKDTTAISYSEGRFWWYPDYHLANGKSTPHNSLISGKSDGWIQSTFFWQWYIPVRMAQPDTIILFSDSVIIRFKFTSDSINNNKEGWMIDNIYLNAPSSGQCSGIEEYSEDDFVILLPVPSQDFLNVEIKNPAVKPERITIYNVLSEVMFISMPVNREQRFQFDIRELKTGIYFLTIQDKSGNMIRKKFVKN